MLSLLGLNWAKNPLRLIPGLPSTNGGPTRSESGCLLDSILTTVAPKSPKWRVVMGPAAAQVKSTILDRRRRRRRSLGVRGVRERSQQIT